MKKNKNEKKNAPNEWLSWPHKVIDSTSQYASPFFLAKCRIQNFNKRSNKCVNTIN